MRYGMFMMPAHPPERTPYDGIQQDLVEIDWLDELGYSEVWIGEHLTHPWEPYPAGDLIISQAIARTKQIKLCSGGYIPTFHHPAALALRIAQLDHMAQGRYMCGIAAGTQPPDWALTGIDGAKGEHRDAAYEAIDILVKMWTDHVGKTWDFDGKFWSVRNIGQVGPFTPHVETFQKPYPPLAIAGMSPGSDSLKWAGIRGYIPLSVFFNAGVLKSHWAVYSEAAASSGHIADRTAWRVNREIFVAETDREAGDYVRGSFQARMWKAAILPPLAERGWLQHLKHDPSAPDADVDIDYLIENLWIVGSPDTVTAKIRALYDEVGGFGVLLGTKYDWGTLDEPFKHAEIYRRNLELLATEVMPRFDEVTAATATA
jgi:alkanesulfonate monooxygenase SsuD/methylene tetrahydromethanopterin reductase-like flavin-dependent oxidoreductase (luciferase family)